MASPITVGTTAVVVANYNPNRGVIRFQNTGATGTIYMKKVRKSGTVVPPSPTDYEVLLSSATLAVESGDAFETNSISKFMAVGSVAGCLLSIYETNKV